MFADEVSYQISKFVRRIKVEIVRVDRPTATRFLAAAFILLAIFTVPQNDRKSSIVNRQSEAEIASQEDSSNNQQFNSLAIQPFRIPDSPPMATISARAAFVIDSQTDTVLLEKNADQRLPMASLTKIMTALVVLENYRLDETVTVPEACTGLPPLKVGLAAGEKLSVEALLYGMLVSSGSDAACALSHHFRGDFLELMNQKAEKLGLSQTHFENEVGLDGENDNHLSTAKDLVKLSQEALRNGVFRKIVGTEEWHGLTSTNELLFTMPGITGVKTGLTERAKGCLAVSYERDGREIIGVILGSEDRFLETQKILKWIFKVYSFPKTQS